MANHYLVLTGGKYARVWDFGQDDWHRGLRWMAHVSSVIDRQYEQIYMDDDYDEMIDTMWWFEDGGTLSFPSKDDPL